MRLHVAEPGTLDGGYGSKCTDLIRDDALELGRTDVHVSPAEARQIWKAGMGTCRDAVALRKLERAAHDGRIPRMKTAGNVGGRDTGQHTLVVPITIGAKRLADVGVQINLHG